MLGINKTMKLVRNHLNLLSMFTFLYINDQMQAALYKANNFPSISAEESPYW